MSLMPCREAQDSSLLEEVLLPGATTDWMRHESQNDQCQCVTGTLTLEWVDHYSPHELITYLEEGQGCRIRPRTLHRLSNTGAHLCRYIRSDQALQAPH